MFGYQIPVLLGGGDSFNPYALPNLAARYDLSNLASLDYDGSNRLKLASDLSGNSAVNGLVLGAVTGNYASAPDSVALSITGDIDIRCNCSLTAWVPSAISMLAAKDGNANGNRSWEFFFDTSGKLNFAWSTTGTGYTTATSTIAAGISNFSTSWVRVTLDVDNGASGNTATFYTSTDGTTWTQLGSPVVTAAVTSIFDSASSMTVGGWAPGNTISGIVHRAQIYNGIAGTLVFDADFTAQAKLVGSFTESSVNAATVTINASGDTGARICGERDLYQATSGKKLILTLDALGNYATSDGVNDFLKSAAFPLNQPTTLYIVANILAWTAFKTIVDGSATTNRMVLSQTGVTPAITHYAGTANANSVSGLPLNSRGVLRSVFSGAASSNGVNLQTSASGENPGTNSPQGITLGAAFDGTSAINAQISEVMLFSVAHDTATQLRGARALMRKWNIAG